MSNELSLQIGANNPILRKIAVAVTNDEIENGFVQDLSDNMKIFMKKYEGIGIAAPQVGVSKRVFLMHKFTLGDIDTGKVQVVCNPEIIKKSKKILISKEGCLSLPRIEGEVERFAEIEVIYIDDKGKTKKEQLKRLNAIVFQHELDHLDGILFIDRLQKSLDYNVDDLVL